MFGNLVESGSHLQDLKRRSSFFLGTLVFYTALMAVAGVGSIYAYNVHLDEQAELELTTMLRFPATPARAEEEQPPRRQVEPRRATPASGDTRPARVAVVTEEIRNNSNLSNRPAERTDAPEIPAGQPVEIGPANIPAIGGGVDPTSHGTSTHGTPGGPLVPPDAEIVPERRRPAETTPQQQPAAERRAVNLSQGVIAGKATHKPPPVYPDIAKQAGASGTVAVQILVDEQGRVVSARATSGHPLLRKAAVEAALRARFSPTLLSNQPVKVTGIINYNFVLR